MHSSSPSVLCAKCLSKLDHLSDPLFSENSQMISSYARNGYNLPLSPKEITQIDTFLVDGSEGLSEYETAIAEVEGLLISLKNSRDMLQRRCDSARYLVSAPIRRLPPDVLHEIFMFFCEMDAPDKARYGASGVYTLYIEGKTFCPTLKLTWVCSFWRTFIQSCPKLWSSISVYAEVFESRPCSLQLLAKYISHSASSLLDFSLSFGYSDSGPIVQEAIELLWDCSTRWRRAIICGDQFLKAVATLMIKSQTQLRSFPALEGLEIMTRTLNWPSRESFLRCLSSCPRLRVVKLLSFSWSGHNADFSCVTSLTLVRFIGKSFGHLLRRLAVLESLEVHQFELSEDDVDDGSYTSLLTKLSVSYPALQPIAWRSTCLPHLTDVTLTIRNDPPNLPLNLLCLSSVLDDSRCQLENLRINQYQYGDPQTQKAIHDLIASQHSLIHVAIRTDDIIPFSRFLQGDVLRNLRSLEFKARYDDHILMSICDVIESRCTVLYFPDGKPEISGLQALTLTNLVNGEPYTSPVVRDRLSLLKEAGFKLAGGF